MQRIVEGRLGESGRGLRGVLSRGGGGRRGGRRGCGGWARVAAGRRDEEADAHLRSRDDVWRCTPVNRRSVSIPWPAAENWGAISCHDLNRWIVCGSMDLLLIGVSACWWAAGWSGRSRGCWRRRARGRGRKRRCARRRRAAGAAARAGPTCWRRSSGRPRGARNGLEAALREAESQRAIEAGARRGAGAQPRGAARAARRRQGSARRHVPGAGRRGAARQPGGFSGAGQRAARRRPHGGPSIGLEARQAAQQKAIEGMVAPVRASLEKVDEQIRAMERERGTRVRRAAPADAGDRGDAGEAARRDRQPGERAEGAGGARALGRDAAPAGRRAGRHARALRLRRAGDRRSARTGGCAPTWWCACRAGATSSSTPRRRSARTSRRWRRTTRRRAPPSCGSTPRRCGRTSRKLGRQELLGGVRGSTPEMVVMFLPGELALQRRAGADAGADRGGGGAAGDAGDADDAARLLRTASCGWREERLAENAQRISDEGRRLHERIATVLEHFADLGNSLNQSVKHFNKALRSFERAWSCRRGGSRSWTRAARRSCPSRRRSTRARSARQLSGQARRAPDRAAAAALPQQPLC